MPGVQEKVLGDSKDRPIEHLSASTLAQMMGSMASSEMLASVDIGLRAIALLDFVVCCPKMVPVNARKMIKICLRLSIMTVASICDLSWSKNNEESDEMNNDTGEGESFLSSSMLARPIPHYFGLITTTITVWGIKSEVYLTNPLTSIYESPMMRVSSCLLLVCFMKPLFLQTVKTMMLDARGHFETAAQP